MSTILSFTCKKNVIINPSMKVAFVEGKEYKAKALQVGEKTSLWFKSEKSNEYSHCCAVDFVAEHFVSNPDYPLPIKQRIYICGPITDMPDFNKPLFARAEQALIEQGYEPINPHNLCAHHVKELDGEELWRACMKTDIAELVDCDMILLLPDWQRSHGAVIERNLANDLGITIKYPIDFAISI